MMLPMSTAPAVRPRRQSNSSFRDRTRRLAALVIPIRVRSKSHTRLQPKIE